MSDVAQQDEQPTQSAGVLRETGRSLAAVWKNRNLRRIELGFAGSAIGDWAYATAIAVWAYEEGGATAVGIWMAIRYVLMAVSAPFTSTLADKMPRRRLMLLADFARAVLISVAATCLFLDTPAWPVYFLATAASLLGTPFMVAQRSLLPTLADRPEELTAANGVASTVESLAFFAGPALAAALLSFADVPVVLLVNVATFVWSMALVLGVSVPVRAEEPMLEGGGLDGGGADHAGEAESVPEVAPLGFLTEVAEGFRAIRSDSGLLLVSAATCVQTVIAGASVVFMLVMADTVLAVGPRGVGYLDAVLGVGSILGGMVAISRAARQRLGFDLAIGVLLWSAPLMLVTIWPSPISCFVAMALLGLGNPLVDVNLDTIVQRLAPDEVLGRVFGSLEACFIATMALGALLMPFVIDWFGLRLALLIVSAPVVVALLAVLPGLTRLDSRLRQPDSLGLISAVDIFGPLSPAAREGLARGARPVEFAAGEVLVREGATADKFFVIERGLVEVTQADRVLRREGPGEYFGEIGLLRDVPRTATVTAVEATVVQVIERDDFLTTVTGHREARATAENIATRRLAV